MTINFKIEKYNDLINSNDNNFKNSKVLLIGTFDLLHNGHFNLINKNLNIFEPSSVVIAVSSDDWNVKKGKFTIQTESERINALRKYFPLATICLEKSTSSFSYIPDLVIKYGIEYISLGEDQIQAIDKIKNILSKNNLKVNFIVFKRTKDISTTVLKKTYDLTFDIVDIPVDEINDKLHLNPWSKDRGVFEFEDFIYKFYHNESKLKILREIKFHKILNSNNPEAISNNGTIYGLRYGKIHGKTLNNVLIDINVIKSVSEELNNFKNSMVSEKHFSLIEEFLWNFDDAQKFLGLTKNEYEHVRQSAEKIKNRPYVLCHGDLNSRNIILNNGKINFIDFEFAKYFIDVFDLASFTSHSNMESPLREEIFKINNIDHETYLSSMILFLFHDSMANYNNFLKFNILEKYNYSKKQLMKLKHIINYNDTNW